MNKPVSRLLKGCPFCGCKPDVSGQVAPCRSHSPELHHHGWRVLISCRSRRCVVQPSTQGIKYLDEVGRDLARLQEKLIWLQASLLVEVIRTWNRRAKIK